MTADPPVGPVSDFAAGLHEAWRVAPATAYATRRTEEAAALQRIGAEFVSLGVPDCIYRGDGDGWFYEGDDAIFGPIHPADSSLVDVLAGHLTVLAADLQPALVLAPLGVGGHVDHQLVRMAAERVFGRKLVYFEDAPYCHRRRAVKETVASTFGPESAPQWAAVQLEHGDLLAKIAAIGKYRSQIGILFGSHVAMAAQVWQYSRQLGRGVGWCERFWTYSYSYSTAVTTIDDP
jgi:hypothetical protein